MQPKLIRLFIYSAGMALLVSGMAKLVSSFGSDPVLRAHDPLLSMAYGGLFQLAGSIELGIALLCFCSRQIKPCLWLIAWLASDIGAYRLALAWGGYKGPCPCLGSMTESLHIPPQTADTAMKIILAYLLIGSYASLFWLWRQHGKAEGRRQNEEVKPELRIGN